MLHENLIADFSNNTFNTIIQHAIYQKYVCVGRLKFELRTIVSGIQRTISLMIVRKKEKLKCVVRIPNPPIVHRCVNV